MEGPTKKKKSMKQFRMGEHWTRRVALKIMYLGWGYNGNTINAGDPDPAAGNTVEARVIEALERIRLIDSLEQCKVCLFFPPFFFDSCLFHRLVCS